MVGERASVDIRDVGAQDESRTLPPALLLEESRLADRQLDGIGFCGCKGVDCGSQVFDARQERSFAEEAVIDRDVEAPARRWVEQAAHTGRHVRHVGLQCRWGG